MGSILANKSLVAVLGLVVAVALIAGGYFVWQKYYPSSSTSVVNVSPLTFQEAKSADLGSELYQKSQNPIGDKLPDTVAPVPNPIENIYKNPFQ